LRYVRIDTQSREGAPIVPSTTGQWDLARLLAEELRALGVDDVRVSDTCIVYGMVRGNVARPGPVVGFIAHVDTSPAVSGARVNPIVHANYRGGDIVLPADPAQIITVARNPALRDLIGDDIITTDGTTLLGSDDKSGVATIMTMIDVLAENPDIPHGPIAIAFTSDEEVGVGINTFDVAAFGASAAYTVDGEALGEINHETWSARLATVTFHGVSTHPGTAKGVMVNAAYALGDLLTRLPSDARPETTDGRVGFVHPYAGAIDVETSTLKIILRDFEVDGPTGLDAKEQLIRRLAAETEARCPGVRVTVDVVEQYRNMNDVLKDHPRLVEFAFDAARRAGLAPVTRPIRGGTDGSKLTFRGLPCPNIFTGGHNFHSKLEFNSRRGLEKTTETLVHLASMFALP
jgi:tripeptide aminopeptidase